MQTVGQKVFPIISMTYEVGCRKSVIKFDTLFELMQPNPENIDQKQDVPLLGTAHRRDLAVNFFDTTQDLRDP